MLKIGELLLMENLVTPQQLQQALDHQKMRGGRLDDAFVALDFVKEADITSLVSRKYGMPSIDLDQLTVGHDVIRTVPATTARRYHLLPVSVKGKVLSVALSDPTNIVAIDDLKFGTGFNIEPLVASARMIEDAIGRHYGQPLSPSLEVRRDSAANGTGRGESIGEAPYRSWELTDEDLRSVAGLSEVDLDSLYDASHEAEAGPSEEEIDLGRSDANPVIKLANVIFVDALKRGASHIHVEPYEKEFRIRFRIDGILYNVMALPMMLRDPLTTRLKTMARLDLTEKRLPQGGRIRMLMKVEDRSRTLDFDVAVRPTAWGETIVMRMMDSSQLVLDMTRLGFEPHCLERFRNAIARRSGLVLVTGPARSGKTNTLVSAVAARNRPDLQIVTIERRVPYLIPGINQIQVRPGIGLTPAACLRSVEDMSADIVLLDEIDDAETARLVFRLAQRGHLAISTLPTRDASSTFTHLAGWGLEPFLVASTLSLVLAQRLVRRVCGACRADDTANVPEQALVAVGFPRESIGSFRLMKGVGCQRCNGTGYKGRIGLFEVLEITDDIRELIAVGAIADEIKRQALQEGMLTLRMSGLEKIKQGLTTIDEVLTETDF